MIRPLRTASEFRELRSTGRRVSCGPVTLIVRPAEERGESRVAYAIGRRVGNAVERNRLRRRLRAVLTDMDRRGQLPISDYLVICSPAAVNLDHSGLVSALDLALDGLRSVA